MTVCTSPITADGLFEKLKRISVDHPLCRYSYDRCLHLTPLINEIQELKAKRDALILAHTYVHPDIIYGVADHVGDSYGLAKKARSAKEKTILFPSVRFMAETAKILNPEKEVLDPNPNGGCTLADSIDAEEVYRLRGLYPDHTFVCYINTTAAVKAACDLCVTSSNIYRIFERLPSNRIYFLPDRLMAENAKRHLLEKGINKEIIAYPGTCYVHEEFEPEALDLLKKQYPDALVFVHPECKPEVVAKADFVGSTSQMHQNALERQKENRPFLLLTECGVASRLSVEAPQARFVGGCSLCKYMRSNSLDAIARALRNPTPSQIIEIEPSILNKARICIERMFEYAE